jgi:hypothetical protein
VLLILMDDKSSIAFKEQSGVKPDLKNCQAKFSWTEKLPRKGTESTK